MTTAKGWLSPLRRAERALTAILLRLEPVAVDQKDPDAMRDYVAATQALVQLREHLGRSGPRLSRGDVRRAFEEPPPPPR